VAGCYNSSILLVLQKSENFLTSSAIVIYKRGILLHRVNWNSVYFVT
jgi:hypothetical protein